MIQNFKVFESNSKLPLIGLPSGEYIDMSINIFNQLNELNLIKYDTRLKGFTFDDRDYKKIINVINPIDSNKDRIRKFLVSINVKNYHINDDYTVDVIGNVEMKKNMNQLPIQFDYISGDFDISDCKLSTLNGCPSVVEGNFIITNNTLDSLEGGPSEVGGEYDARQCGLKSLKGSPLKINKNFLVSYNNIIDLIGGPTVVDGSYYANNCKLSNLLGSPESVSNNFDCSYNMLEDLFDGPSEVIGTYDCSFNNLKTLEGRPIRAGAFKCTNNLYLIDFSHLPYDNLITGKKPR